MASLFISTYHFFKTRRWLLVVMAIALLVGSGLSVYFADLEEDITKIMPTNEAVEKFNAGFLESELSNRIVMHIHAEEADADGLKEFCQTFVDSLTNSSDKALVRSITYRVDESLYQSVSKTIMEHIPIFLQEKDYRKITQNIEKAEVEKRIMGSYKALISPVSFAFKDIMRRDPMGFSNLALQSLSDFQLDDNFTIDDGYIMTKDKKHVLFFITPSTHAQESTKNGRLIQSIKDIGGHIQAQSYKGLTIEHFGGPAISVANASRIKKDVTLTVSIALLGLLLLITFYYRNLKIFFFILIPVIVGASLALIVLSLIKPSISIISIGVGSVLIGITIDYAIHLFTHYKQKRNITEVLSDISAPLLISCTTTASAFLCLYLVRSEALHDLGLFAALSVIFVGIFALLLLPHLLQSGMPRDVQLSDNKIDHLAAYPFHKNKWFVLSFLGLVLCCSFYAFDTQFETDLNQVNYMPDDLLQAEENINKISAATQRSIYLIGLGDDIDDAYTISEDIHQRLGQMKSKGLIESYTSPNKLMPSAAVQQERIDRWSTYWTADKKAKLKQDIIEASTALKFKPGAYNSFYNSLDKKYSPVSLEDIPDISDALLKDYVINHDTSAAVMTMVRLTSDQKRLLHSTFGDMNQVSIIDKEYIVHQFVDILKSDFDRLVLISLLVVFLILHIVYGRLELALVAFLPIVFSWIITLGVMNLLNIKFNIVNVIITSFIFGLGIDYSIFIMRGLMQKYKYGVENLHSYKTSILLSSTTTLIGIGVLIFAKHPALQSIAAISIIGIVSVLACAFIIEPLLFNLLVYKGDQKREYPLTVFNAGKTLWVYFLLVVGCLVLSIIAIVFTFLFFLTIEFRKKVFHYLIYGFSKFYIKASFLNKVTYINEGIEDFKKPALVIANHKSLIDTPLFFQLTPKILIITNDWVNKHPLYRIVCNMADFYSISNGAENLLEQLAEKVEQGYSVAIFPEGTRSTDESLLRFKRGAFYLAEKLNLDIVPMLIHGSGPFLKKGNFWGGGSNPITVKTMDRIRSNDHTYGDNYSERTKKLSRVYKKWYANFSHEVGDVDYHAYNLRHNYLYKGPLSEWYMKVKTSLEENYRIFDDIIPMDAIITDIGCGYGYMSYMLMLRSDQRSLLGIDYDEEKISVANHAQIKNERIEFITGDVTKMSFATADVFIISDVIHYLKPDEQFVLLDKCKEALNFNGQIILRDGDKDLASRHKGTRLTEIFSTKMGFNKTQNDLNFISGQELKDWAEANDMTAHRLDQTKFTSNVIFVLKKK